MDEINVAVLWLLRGTFGTALAFLFWKTVQFVARNYVALSGQALAHDTKDNCTRPQDTCYVFRLQNLESVPFEYKIIVKITAVLTAEVAGRLDECLKIYAGVKALNFRVERVDNRVTWRVELDYLAPFDTLTFECRIPAEQACFEARADGQSDQDLFVLKLEKALWPTRLVAYRTDVEDARFEGPTRVPVPVLPAVVSASAVCAHLFAVMAVARDKYLVSDDLWIIAIELAAIWLGYALIRRPAQPITTGYRQPTSFTIEKLGPSTPAPDEASPSPCK